MHLTMLIAHPYCYPIVSSAECFKVLAVYSLVLTGMLLCTCPQCHQYTVLEMHNTGFHSIAIHIFVLV